MKGLKQEISDLLNKLNERINGITATDEEVSSIETDILLSLLRELYLKTEKLKVQGSPVIIHEPEPKEVPAPLEEKAAFVPPFVPPAAAEVIESPSQETIISEPEQHEVTIPEIVTSEIVAPEVVIPEVIVPEIKAPAPTPVIEEIVPPQQKPVEPVYIPPAVTSAPTVEKAADMQSDLFGQPLYNVTSKTEAPSINERMTAGKNDLTLSDKMNLKPIHDLKATIGINEKFQFVNELFDGSTETYNQAITRLNSCHNSYEANRLLAEMQAQFSWDTENPICIKLYEYVTRRYIQ